MHDAVSVEHNKMRDIRQLWGKETAWWKANPIQHFPIVEPQNTGINVSEQCTIDGFSSSVGRAFWTACMIIDYQAEMCFLPSGHRISSKVITKKKNIRVHHTVSVTNQYQHVHLLPKNSSVFSSLFSQCHPRRPSLRSPARPPLPTLSWAKPAPAAAWI